MVDSFVEFKFFPPDRNPPILDDYALVINKDAFKVENYNDVLSQMNNIENEIITSINDLYYQGYDSLFDSYSDPSDEEKERISDFMLDYLTDMKNDFKELTLIVQNKYCENNEDEELEM